MTNETYNYSIETFEKMIDMMLPGAIIDFTHRTGEVVISTGLQYMEGKVIPLDGQFLKQ